MKTGANANAECIAVMGSSAKGTVKGRAEAFVTEWRDPIVLLLRLSLLARYRLLNHYANCTLNHKF